MIDAMGTADIPPIRVVIADDHHIWRSGLRVDLGDGFDVVGESEDAATAIDLIEATHPDLALVDLHMPGGGGLAVVRACATVAPIVIITVSEAERDLLDAVATGAVGYLVKSTRPEELRAALRRAAEGEPVFSPQLAALVLTEFRRIAGATGPQATGTGEAALTTREREVLSHVARGHSYARIGEELYISPKTVENHVRNILAKLHLSRRHELIRWAVERGIT
jgi:DNA-binding NarL/FixJ family response regulator